MINLFTSVEVSFGFEAEQMRQLTKGLIKITKTKLSFYSHILSSIITKKDAKNLKISIFHMTSDFTFL